jgi:Rrf2 family protein
MKLSTKSRYGIRALMELAGHYGNGTISVREIAEDQQISWKYLENLFNSLKVAGLIMSRRGPGGGWALTRPPQQIRLGEVIRALEGVLEVVPCLEHEGTCARTGYCATREVYAEINTAILDVLDRYSIDDLYHRKIELDALAPPETLGDDLCKPTVR